MIYNETIILESDSESSVVMTLSIGNTILDELVLSLNEEVYDDDIVSVPKTIAVIDKDNLLLMANRLKIKPADLKAFLVEKFSEGGRLTRNYVRQVFQQMLEFVLNQGAKYCFKK